MQHASDDVKMINRDKYLNKIARDMGRLRQMMGRRFVSRIALSRLHEGHGLELSHFDVITFVARHQKRGDVTVGAIAEQMRIDPSRASRVVADLVKRGALRREACQDDARRTIVRLSDEGEGLAEHFANVRLDLMTKALEHWSEEELGLFAPLFDRFIESFEARMGDFSTEDGGLDKAE